MSELQEASWYVVHTYSGHENKVKATIEKAVKTRGMEDCIRQVVVPTEEVVETTKTGKEKTRQRKVYPSYVLVKMIITDESWYVVRNTKGVTGFVGVGSDPIPMEEEEVKNIFNIIGVKTPKETIKIDFTEGDYVKILKGSFKDQEGQVAEIDHEHGRAKVMVDIFGRMTPVEIEVDGVLKV